MMNVMFMDSHKHAPIHMDIDVAADKFVIDDMVVYRIKRNDAG